MLYVGIMCEQPFCTEYADRLIGAEGTTITYAVCTWSTCASWAKQQIKNDFPARRVTVTVIEQ